MRLYPCRPPRRPHCAGESRRQPANVNEPAKTMQKVDLKALRDAAQVLDETYAGRAAGRQERIETNRQAAENGPVYPPRPPLTYGQHGQMTSNPPTFHSNPASKRT